MACFMAVALVFSIAGCATKSTPTFNAHYYPECYDPIDKLCKDQSNSEEIKGAVAGGLLGALGGAIVGGLATGKVEGALVGAGVGAAAGAITGFFAARLNKIKDQNQRLAEYQNVLGEKSKGWDIERATVERAYKCYNDQITLLKKGYQAKRVTREEALARMNEIKAGIEHINTYWADAQTRMDETLADGDQWLQQEDAQAIKTQQANKLRSQVNRQKQNTTRARQNVKTGNDKTNRIKDTTQLAFNNFDKYLREDKTVAGNGCFMAMLGFQAS